jgi:virginiamycin B lyase
VTPVNSVARTLQRRSVLVGGAVIGVAAIAGTAVYLRPRRDPRAALLDSFVEYRMPEQLDMPTAIAAGPDGAVWFTIGGADAIGRVRDGHLERLAKPGTSVEPIGIAATADGGAWFTDVGAGAVSRIASTGEVKVFPIDTAIVRLGRLAVAPDGSPWFAESTLHSITQLKDGALQRHAVKMVGGGPYGVAVAADGTVWGTLQNGNRLLRIAPDGEVSTFDIPRRGAVPTDIAVATDGSVYFLEFRANQIGRMKEGRFEEFAVEGDNAGLSGLAVAQDGAVWFGLIRRGSLGRLRAGTIETFPLPRPNARPYSVAVDGAGNIWYADITGYVGMLRARYAQA